MELKKTTIIPIVLFAIFAVSTVAAVVMLWTSPILSVTGDTLIVASDWTAPAVIQLGGSQSFAITVSNGNPLPVTTSIYLGWAAGSDTTAAVTVDGTAYTMGTAIPITSLAPGAHIDIQVVMVPSQLGEYQVVVTQ